MKTFLSPSLQPSFPRSSNRRGVALVIVLAMLVLLSTVLIAFMLSASNERTAAQASSAQVTTRQIADSTVNLVLAQIRDATSQPGADVTWSSQPGAIRTFGGTLSNTKKTIQATGGPTGAFYYDYNPSAKDFVYKLYSADQMKPSSDDYKSSDLPAEVGVIEKWDPKNPTPDYVDLNQPYLSIRTDLDPAGLTVEPHYPIIDPRAKYLATEAENSTDNPGIVDGFDAKISKDDRLKMAKAAGGTGDAVPYLPMPVKWLYVLKDGTVGSASMATVTNPMVGRTAFWADDESCKLNVNTASEGTFWDTPSVSTEQESGRVDSADGNISSSATSLSLAVAQPARGEYQRYPGHPATTCLSPVLGWLWDVPYSASTLATASILPKNNPTYQAYKEAIYQITAFTPFGNGTTKGATGNTDPVSDDTKPPILNIVNKHLFTTVDEMMFTAKRTTGGAAGKSVANAAANAKFTPSALEKVRFFLSANSRSPELNLYSRPRVTIWPIAKSYDLRTPFDDLFAFTSTISKDPGGNEDQDKRYYLTREDAKSATKDYDGSTQNQKMYSYLKSLTSQAVPGFGGSFSTKYPNDRDQILTEIFDYMRTVNLVDTGTASRSANVFVPYTPRYYPPGTLDQYTNRPARSVDWSGQVTPLKINNTMGMGRFPTVREAALIFHRVGPTVSGQQASMQAVLALEMATPMAGFPAIRETYYTKIIVTPNSGKPLKIGVGATPVADADLCTKKLVNIPNVSSHEACDGRGFMPNMGCTSSMLYFTEHKAPTDPTNVLYKGNPDNDTNRDKTFTATAKNFISTDASNLDGQYARQVTVKNYPYISKAFPVAAADTQFTFEGPELDVEIWSGESPADQRSVKVQTIHLKFPAASQKVPVPKTNSQMSFKERFTDTSLGGSADTVSSGNDTVRSIELTGGATALAAKGDLRLAMVLPDVPNTYFEPRDGPGTTGYGSTTNARVHGLTRGHGDAMSGYTGASTIARGGTNRNKPPMIPKGIDGVVRLDGGPGDWDRGLSKHVNGAMGNKVDEGNIKFSYGSGASQRSPYFLGRSIEDTGQTFFTPNRQLSSAIMFGSLPTGAKSLPPKPWQTLLFRPDRELGNGHPGGKTSNGPTDHLILDLFHLPVVEPYAISEPFSTAGKVNMNYVIAPFGYAKGEAGNVGTMRKPRSYIRRDTAMRGVLKSTFMMAVPNTAPDAGHSEDSISGPAATNTYRFPIDLDKTIEEMEARLNDQSVGITSRPTTLFRSASEICEIDLFPKGQTVNGSWGNYWDILNSQTGDNMRERPYSFIFPRLTTKSNVFTVHMRCQAIKKAPGGDQTKFDPVKDQIVGEYRGSSIIERFIDPNDPNLATYDETADKVDAYYRYRIVATKQFSPH